MVAGLRVRSRDDHRAGFATHCGGAGFGEAEGEVAGVGRG